jgi:tRNA-Thr(GGU) m(6)t(6)A37 methyltransferase TsaA
LVFDPTMGIALQGLHVGTEIIVVTWLHHATRGVLAVHPRGDSSRARQGVFSTRSPDRPNPIGLHTVRILALEPTRIRVRNLEAIDGTPILDVKPVLEPRGHR